MPLPADYGTGHVTGKFVTLGGAAVVGYLTFSLQPDVQALIDPAHDTVIMPAPHVVNLDGSGAFAVDLPATDDPDITPSGWSYVVEETFSNARGRTYSLSVPVGGAVDISQVVIAAPAPAVTTINWGPSSDHAARVESILAHGADPLGGADSASAVTAALAQSDNGGTAYLPEGVFRCDTDVNYPTPNTTTFQPSPRLQGAGPNLTIVIMSPDAKINVTAPTIDGTGAFTAGPQAFIEIDGITFLGAGGGTCLYLHRYFKLLISNCRFDRQPGAAYSFDKCIESVRALQTTPTRHDDLQIQAQINNCLFMFFNVGYDDLALSSPANTAFNNCYFQGLTPADTAAQQVIDPDFASVGIRTCSNSLGGVGTSFVSLDVGLWLDQGGESNQVDVLPKGIHLDRWHFEGNRYADVHIERCVGLKMTAPFFIERHGADASRIPYAVYIAENGSSQCHDVTIDGGSVFPSQDATYGPDWRMIYAGSALRSDSAVRVQTVNSLMLGDFVDEDASRFDRVVIAQGNHKIGVGQNVNVDGYRAPGDTADRFANRPNGPWWSDGSSVADTGLNRTAGLDVPGVLNVIDETGAQLGSVLKPSLTATNLLDVGHWINTWGKVTGREVWDATNGLLVVASGGAASDPWRWAWGDTAYTPGGSASPPIVPITRGGTGADNATDARTNLDAEVAGAAALAQAAAEAYADGLVTGAITGRSWKDPVRVVATVNLTLSGTQTIDGVAVIAGDQVLATAQTSGADNGPWVVASGAWTRPTDFDTSAEAVPGSVFPASEGTDNGNREWFLTTDAPITLGTTVLTFASVPMSAPVTSVDGLAGAVVLPTDAAAGTGSKRTLGTGPTQAAAGNDSRLSDSRAPTGAAGGALSGTYPNPTIADGSLTPAKVAGTAVITSDSRLSDARTPTAHASTHVTGGTDVIPTAVASGAAGLLSGTDKAKLDGVAAGATANSSDATLLARANHTGTESADVLTDGTTNKAFLATERTKLAGIATGATANSSDATLLNRANHTGTQAESTVTGLVTDLAAKEATANKDTASGYAGLDAGGAVTGQLMPPRRGQGLASRALAAALAKASTQLVVDAWITDSFGFLGTSSGETKVASAVYEAAMAHRLNALERTSGYMPVSEPNATSTGVQVTWDTVGGTTGVSYGGAWQAGVSMTGSAFSEVTRYGDAIEVFYTAQRTGGATATVTIGGTTVGTINSTDATIPASPGYDSGRKVFFRAPLGWGSLDVKVQTDATANTFLLDAVRFVNDAAVSTTGAAGFAVHKLGRSGWTAGDAKDSAPLLQHITNNLPPIVTIAIGTNDFAGGSFSPYTAATTASTFATRLSSLFANVRACYSFTATIDTTANTLTPTAANLIPGNRFVNGQKVTISSLATSTGIYNSNTYYVVGATSTTFQLAATSGGSAIDITGSNGTCTVSAPLPAIRYIFQPAGGQRSLTPDATWLTTWKAAAREVCRADGDVTFLDWSEVVGVYGPSTSTVHIGDPLDIAPLDTISTLHPGDTAQAWMGRAVVDATPIAGPVAAPPNTFPVDGTAHIDTAISARMLVRGINSAPGLAIGRQQWASQAPTNLTNQTLGQFQFVGFNAVDSIDYLGAQITGIAEGSWGTTGYRGTGLRFWTAAVASSAAARVVAGIGNDGTLWLGPSSGSSVASIDASGNVLASGTLGVTGAGTVGGTFGVTGDFNVNALFTVTAASGNATTPGTFGSSDHTITHYAATAAQNLVRVNGSSGSASAILTGQTIASLTFRGARDSTPNLSSGAIISAVSEEGWGSTAAGGRLVFSTTPNTTTTPLVRMLIDNAGKLYIGSSTSATTNIDQSGNALFAGTLGVTGLLTASAAATVGTTLGVTGTSTLAAVSIGNGVNAGTEVARITSTATNDDPVEIVTQYRAATTNATVTTLATIAVPSTTILGYWITVVARRTDVTEEGAFFVLAGAARNSGGAAQQFATGSSSPTSVYTSQTTSSTWACTVDANSSNLRIRVTGVAATSITWHATVRTYTVST